MIPSRMSNVYLVNGMKKQSNASIVAEAAVEDGKTLSSEAPATSRTLIGTATTSRPTWTGTILTIGIRIMACGSR